MRSLLIALVSSAALLGPMSVMAQKLPANAPAGTTVQCKDGSFESPEQKSGACSGHKGIQTWYGKAADKAADKASDKTSDKTGTKTADKTSGKAADKTGASAPALQTQSADVRKTEVAPSTGTATKAPANQDPAKMATAAGGGAGKVWVNESTKVYHCMGDRYYGKTKQGEYMSESDATAKGMRPANKKTCAAS